MMQAYDVVVIGGGMVGLALACSLRDSELRVAVIDTQVDEPLPAADTPPSLRVSALSQASRRYLEQLGAWPAIQQSGRTGAYRTMQVWERDSFGEVNFSASDVGCEHLGHIVENRVIRQALWQQLSSQDQVQLLVPARCQQLMFGEREAFITLDNGNTLTARLVVGADGANSWLRRQADIPLTSWDYNHHALVASVRTELPHQQCARQAFQPDGPLAFLPLWQDNLCSIVWSLPPQKAQALCELPQDEFNKRLTVAFDHRLGRVALEGERLSLPLKMRYARRFVDHRVALIGDAAHTIHPLAGQGVNLGLEDARELASYLRKLAASERDIGQVSVLRGWERERKSAAGEMIAAMEGFKQLYGNKMPPLRLARNLGLVLANQITPLKRALIQQALGFSKREILKGIVPFTR